MNLLRKMSSKMRSSSKLSASGENFNKDDAPAAHQRFEDSSDREDEEEEEEVVKDFLRHDPEQDDGDEFEDAAAAPAEQQGQPQQKNEEAPIRVRAPVSDEQDDDDDGAKEEDEEEDDEAAGARPSLDSVESFDSALERIAASSDASYDTALSPKISSPVGSVPGPGGIENPSGSTDLTKSEEINDSEQKTPKVQSDDTRSVGASPGINSDQSKRPASPMPKAKITADDDDLEGSDDEAEKGEGSPSQITGKEPVGISDSGKAPNSVPNSNGGIEKHAEGIAARDVGGEQQPASQPAMPVAKPSAEDEDGIEERDDEELEDLEEPMEEAVGEEDEGGPMKIRAVPSDLDDNVVLPYVSPPPELDEDDDENSVPAKVHVPSEETEGTQTRPVARPSDDESSSPEDHPDGQAPSSGTQEAVSREAPSDESRQGPDNSAGEAGSKGEESGQIPFDEKGGAEMEDFLRNLGDTEGEEEEDEEDEGETDEDEASFMERSEALAALLREAESAARDDASGGAAPSLGSAGPSLPARPTRTVRSSLPSLDAAARTAPQPRSAGDAPIRSSRHAEENNEPADGNEETREKLQSIRVKFLRLASRLGQSHHNVVVAQVLYRLGLAEQLRGGRASRNTAFSFDRASSIAEEQERAGQGELDFACTIMILGKTGVGKSATINSIFDEGKTRTNAFSPATKQVQIITGLVHGIKVRVIDTPGLLPSVADQRHNEKIMGSVKNFIKKQSPDIVLYFDRLDMQSRDYGDLPLLRTITDTFGAPVWFNAIVVLTHASSAPPDGPNGVPLSYEMFVAQRSHVVQQTIRQAAGDMRLMNPVSLVENHAACRVNRTGDRVLPNGQVWKPQLLLLCFASKILAEANTLLKLQDNTPGRPFGQRARVPPLPFLLSSLLQSRAPLKMPDEQVGDEDESDEELDEDEDDSEDEEDYDQLPPFRRLAKEEVAELDEVNRAEYFEELAERERLFQRKQWKEELKRRRELKRRMAEAPADQSQLGDDGGEEDVNRFAAVPVPMPDMVLPPSFDSDNPSHRYRYLETANQWLVRPVLETHGWDHDNGYDGMSLEKIFVFRDKIPTSVSGQITKDKKEANLNMECAASLKHGEGKVTLAGLDLQTVGKDLAYTLRSETRFSNFRGNKTTGGLALTLLGDTVSAGMKIEDRLIVGKRVKLVVNGGAITGGGDVAYGGSLEATLRDREYPLSRTLSTLGVSIMDWHGDLAVGGNLQSQFILGKTVMVGRANLNNRGAGQISIRASSSEQLQMTLIGILPIVRAIANRLFGQSQ